MLNNTSKLNDIPKKETKVKVAIINGIFALIGIIAGWALNYFFTPDSYKDKFQALSDDYKILEAKSAKLRTDYDDLITNYIEFQENHEQLLVEIGYPMYDGYPNVPDFGIIRGYVLYETIPVQHGNVSEYTGTFFLYVSKSNQNTEYELQKYADVLDLHGFIYEGKEAELFAEELQYIEGTEKPAIILFNLEKYNNSRGDIVLCGYGHGIDYNGNMNDDVILAVFVYDTMAKSEGE